jgi:RND superfamily putative drug exporter
VILDRLGRFLVRRRRPVLAFSSVAVIASVLFSAGLFDRLKFEVFVDQRSEAYQGRLILEDEFGRGAPNVLFVVTAKAGSVDDPGTAAAAEALVTRLAAEPGVTDVASYWSLGRNLGLRSHDGDRALVVARIPGDDKLVDSRIRELRPRYHVENEAIDMRLGGSAEFLRELLDISLEDQQSGELITIPIILVALVLVFGSVVAASLPLMIAVITLVGTGVVLRLMTEFTNVSVFALAFVSTLGLGLAIDYSLFVVNRFREELAAGAGTDVAVVRTVRTAGRTVLFSAAAVMAAFTALVLAPLQFLQSIGYAGMAAAAMAGIGSLIILPATLAVLGRNVNRWTVWKRSTRPANGRGFWHWSAVVVMRRPLVFAGGVIAVLLLVASPGWHFKPGLGDERERRHPAFGFRHPGRDPDLRGSSGDARRPTSRSGRYARRSGGGASSCGSGGDRHGQLHEVGSHGGPR